MSINQRIRERRSALGLTLNEVARACGLSAWQTVQAWERDSAPTRKKLDRVAEVLQVSPEWLLTGRGQQERELVSAFSELSGTEAQLVMYFRLLNRDQQSKILQSTHELATAHFDQFGGAPLQPTENPASSADLISKSRKGIA
jgi:transcriptional regulator with XRE-family HTH domain